MKKIVTVLGVAGLAFAATAAIDDALLSYGKIPWRRERLPIPVFWPGVFHGLYSPWGRKESDMTE